MTTIHDVYARLVVEGADAALDFYRDAFGGEVVERSAGPDGRVQHAAVALGRFRFAVKDAGHGDPAPTGPTPVVMALYVDDPDAVVERVLSGGGTVVHPVTDHDYGERAGRVRDPWGHQWMVARKL